MQNEILVKKNCLRKINSRFPSEPKTSVYSCKISLGHSEFLFPLQSNKKKLHFKSSG